MTKKHDDLLARIEAFNEANGGVVIQKAAKGYSLFSKDSVKPIARLRPTGKGDQVEFLWWSHRETVVNRTSIPRHKLLMPKVLLGLGASLEFGQEGPNAVRAGTGDEGWRLRSGSPPLEKCEPGWLANGWVPAESPYGLECGHRSFLTEFWPFS